MIKNPVYSEDVIVLVKNDNNYSWYLSEKSIWVMDYNKWINSFGAAAIDLSAPAEREGSEILNKNSWETFKGRNIKLETNKEELRGLVKYNLPITSWDEKGELFPSLFLDFDQKTLYSLFPEGLEFEKYVPENWIGLYEDFYSLIPDNERYWIIDGVDYFPKG